MPVALADISGGTATIRYIHTGQIDEPLAVTSAAQAIIWNGYVDPMGNGSTFSTPTLSPALDMRLPGQSFQLETGSLSQNHFRDYDPSLGRYIEADPLGIDAGQNVFAYVDGDPVNDADPAALQTVTINTGDGKSITFPVPLPVAQGLCALLPASCSVNPAGSGAPPASSSGSSSSSRSNTCHC